MKFVIWLSKRPSFRLLLAFLAGMLLAQACGCGPSKRFPESVEPQCADRRAQVGGLRCRPASGAAVLRPL